MFGRRKRPEAADPVVQPGVPAVDEPAASTGPWDAAEVDLESAAADRVDLGSLLVTGIEGLELRLQADQDTGAVTAVLFAGPDSGLELRVFAAPKSGGLWAELRREMTAETTRLGGTVDELDGPHGPQLRLQIPVKTSDGRRGVQTSRVAAVEGPRWLLRATFLGAAVDETRPREPLEQALRQVVVVRGADPMPPRQPLPLRLPPDARTASQNGGGDDSAS
ncbi:DUF3710 domain-containing protein [soil metagenome]